MDVAEVTCTFSDFVASVSYSATPQGFMERPGAAQNSKHIRTLAQRHVVQVAALRLILSAHQ